MDFTLRAIASLDVIEDLLPDGQSRLLLDSLSAVDVE